MNQLLFQAESLVRGIRFRLTRRLQHKHPTELWQGIESVEVRSKPFLSRFGNVTHYELHVILAAVRHIDAQRIFEFGTFDGLTTWHLAVNAGPGAIVYTLDLPPDHSIRQNPKHDRTVGKIFGVSPGEQLRNLQGHRVEQLFQDSLQFDPTPLRGQIDLCFIDASHEYKHVRCDTINALEMVRPGGIILWHDYSRWWPGVQKCLDDLAVEFPVCRITNTSLAALIKPTGSARSKQAETAVIAS